MIFKSKPKIFCISTQRTGTTSVGEFFRRFDYKVAGWRTSSKAQWTYHWSIGDFEKIFRSTQFKRNEVFEDDPWWCPEFYKVLFHRFPDSKFVLFTRNGENWFKSMLSHSGGKILGNSKIHCEIYRREADFYNLPKDILENYNPKSSDQYLELTGHENHYINLYELRNTQIIEFFKSQNSQRLFHDTLENPNKWENLAHFFNLTLPEGFDVHANRSPNQNYD